MSSLIQLALLDSEFALEVVCRLRHLLPALLHDGSFTYGRTFVGALLAGSGNRRWNPAIRALTLMHGGWNRVDLNQLSSGGLVPVSMWEYAAFGWPGAVLVSFLSGLISGAA